MSQYPPSSGSAPPQGGAPPSWANSPAPQGQWPPPHQPTPPPHPYAGHHQQQQQPSQQQPSPYGQPFPPQHQPYHGGPPGGPPVPQPYGQPQPYPSPGPGQGSGSGPGHSQPPFGSPSPYGQPHQPSPHGQVPPGQFPPGQQPGAAGAPPPAGVAPGYAPYQGPAGSAPPRPSGGLMGQVNHAVSSGKPLLQNLGNKFGKKFGNFGLQPMPTTQPNYGQPSPYGGGQAPPPAYGQPQAAYGQPPQPAYGQPPAQPGQPPLQQHPAQSPPPGAYGGPPQSAGVSPAPSSTTAATSSPPAAAPDPLSQSMGKLGLGGAATAAAHHLPPGAPANLPASPAKAVDGLSRPGQKWTFVDLVTEQPTPEFRIIASLMFEALDGKGSREVFLDASKILEQWKANGLPNEWAVLFAHDDYRSFSLMWALSGIPHVMLPRTPALAPSTASFAPFAANSGPATPSPLARIPEKAAEENAPRPRYIPALNLGGYIESLFLDFFDDPSSLPDLVRRQCGDLHDPARGHPDLALFDPSVPAELQKRAKAVRAAAAQIALSDAAAAAGSSPAAVDAQPAFQPTHHQAAGAALNHQTTSHAGASTGAWTSPRFG